MSVPLSDAEHQRQQRQLPAEERADHRQHLHVAHAEAFFVPDAVVDLRDRAQHAAADQDADERRHPARAR